MDSLFVGVLLTYLVCQCDLINRLKKQSLLVFILILTISILILGLSYKNLIGALDHSLYNFLYALILIAIISHRKGLLGKLLRIKAFQFLDLISYGVYLFHQFISGVLHAILLNQQPRLNNIKDLGVMLLALGVSFLVAYVLHILIERPPIRFAHQFKYN